MSGNFYQLNGTEDIYNCSYCCTLQVEKTSQKSFKFSKFMGKSVNWFFLSQLPADEVKTATEVVVEETVVPSESTKEESPAVKEPKEETSQEITSQQGIAFCSMYDCWYLAVPFPS